MNQFNIDRFVVAQDMVYPQVLEELKDGHKTTHWMWYVFPQFAGLGKTPMARLYSIHSLEEARHYLYHHILGERLEECVNILLSIHNKDAFQIFGNPDCLKFRSCLTLFDCVHGDYIFKAALDKFYDGDPDKYTLCLLDKVKEVGYQR